MPPIKPPADSNGRARTLFAAEFDSSPRSCPCPGRFVNAGRRGKNVRDGKQHREHAGRKRMVSFMQNTSAIIHCGIRTVLTLMVCVLTAGVSSAEPLSVTSGDYAASFKDSGAFALSYRGQVLVDRDDLQLVNTRQGWKGVFSYGASKAQQRKIAKNSVNLAESVPGQISFTREVEVGEDGVTCQLDYQVSSEAGANRNYYFLNIPQEVLAGSYFEGKTPESVVRGDLTSEKPLTTLVGPERITFVGPRYRIQFDLAAEGATWLLMDWTRSEHKSYRLRVENELSGKPLDVSLRMTVRVWPSSPADITQAKQMAKAADQARRESRFTDLGLRQRQPLTMGTVQANAQSIEQYRKLELTLDVTGNFDNPFDPDQIDVSAEFVAPSGKRIRTPAFFYQDCELREDGVQRVGASVWKVRFTPTEAGRYTYRVTAQNRGESAASPIGNFQCTPAVSPGFVRTSKNSPLYLEFQNGGSYIPSGLNLFYSTRLDEPISPDRLTYCQRCMNRLADQQGNFVRLRMDSWWLAIEMTPDKETGYLGLGYYHQPSCWELDRIYDLAAERGIYVMHCLDNANANVNLPPEPCESSPNNWRVPYNLYTKANGGVLDEPAQFWSDPEARRYVRNKLRYCVARWGYSPQLMSWEFWNEVSCQKDTIEAATVWHRDMARYLRSIDSYSHPITTSLMGDHELADRIWELPEMDILQFHHYARSEIVPAVTEMTQDVIRKHNKPFFLGEYGLGPQFRPGNCDFDSRGLHMHNGMWAALMSGGCGAGAMWYVSNYVDTYDLYGHYQPLARFAGRVPWNDGQLHPCRVDSPTLAEPPNELHELDLMIPAGAKYGLSQPPSTDITISSDGQIDGGEFVRPSLHCSKSRKAPPTFHLELDKPGVFVIDVSASVGNETNKLMVYLDDRKVIEEPFPAGEEFHPQSTEIPQYKNWRTPYNRELTLSVPAGSHTVRPEATGKDRIEVQYALRGAVAFEKAHPVRVLGFATSRAAYLWLQNRSSTWWTAWEGKSPIALPAMTTQIHGLEDGTYRIEWFDTRSGQTQFAADAVSQANSLRLTIPPLRQDAACIVKAK